MVVRSRLARSPRGWIVRGALWQQRKNAVHRAAMQAPRALRRSAGPVIACNLACPALPSGSKSRWAPAETLLQLTRFGTVRAPIRFQIGKRTQARILAFRPKDVSSPVRSRRREAYRRGKRKSVPRLRSSPNDEKQPNRALLLYHWLPVRLRRPGSRPMVSLRDRGSHSTLYAHTSGYKRRACRHLT